MKCLILSSFLLPAERVYLLSNLIHVLRKFCCSQDRDKQCPSSASCTLILLTRLWDWDGKSTINYHQLQRPSQMQNFRISSSDDKPNTWSWGPVFKIGLSMYWIYVGITKSTSPIEFGFSYAIMWYLQCFIEETSVPAKGHKDNGDKKIFSHPASIKGYHTLL